MYFLNLLQVITDTPRINSVSCKGYRLISVQICLTGEWRSGILARNVQPIRC